MPMLTKEIEKCQSDISVFASTELISIELLQKQQILFYVPSRNTVMYNIKPSV